MLYQILMGFGVIAYLVFHYWGALTFLEYDKDDDWAMKSLSFFLGGVLVFCAFVIELFILAGIMIVYNAFSLEGIISFLGSNIGYLIAPLTVAGGLILYKLGQAGLKRIETRAVHNLQTKSDIYHEQIVTHIQKEEDNSARELKAHHWKDSEATIWKDRIKDVDSSFFLREF